MISSRGSSGRPVSCFLTGDWERRENELLTRMLPCCLNCPNSWRDIKHSQKFMMPSPWEWLSCLTACLCSHKHRIWAEPEHLLEHCHGWTGVLQEGHPGGWRESLWRQQGCTELCPGMDNERAQNLQLRISGSNNVGTFELLPAWLEGTDEPFCRQPEEISCLQALVLMGDSNHPDTCWTQHSRTQHKWSERFLEHRDGDFLMQRVEEPARGDTRIDRIQTWRLWAGLASVTMSLEFKVLTGGRSAKTSITILNFRTDFVLFKDLFGRIPWDMALNRWAIPNSWLIFRVTSSKLEDGPAWQAGKQTKVAEGLNGQRRARNPYPHWNRSGTENKNNKLCMYKSSDLKEFEGISPYRKRILCSEQLFHFLWHVNLVFFFWKEKSTESRFTFLSVTTSLTLPTHFIAARW